LRQQAREHALREQQETRPDVRLSRRASTVPDHLPAHETPYFPIQSIRLDCDDAAHFLWALKVAVIPSPVS
jgi:hemolysin activation/secretion protein